MSYAPRGNARAAVARGLAMPEPSDYGMSDARRGHYVPRELHDMNAPVRINRDDTKSIRPTVPFKRGKEQPKAVKARFNAGA